MLDDDTVVSPSLSPERAGLFGPERSEPKKKERCWRCNGSGKELRNGLFGLEAWTCSRCWGSGEEK